MRMPKISHQLHKTVSLEISNRLYDGMRKPGWLDAVAEIPPSEIYTRTQPVRHRPHSKIRSYRPQKIFYMEDELRATFYKHHPWELARPRIITEYDGRDAYRHDWGTGLRQPDMPVCGESVVQRQMWLMENEKMNKATAYDKVRREFYKLRQQEDIERRIAKEEAQHVGAYFTLSRQQLSGRLEDEEYERWKKWARQMTNKFNIPVVAGEVDSDLADIETSVAEPEVGV